MHNFEYKYLLKNWGEFLGNLGEILGKYRTLDVESLGSKGLKLQELTDFWNMPHQFYIQLVHISMVLKRSQ